MKAIIKGNHIYFRHWWRWYRVRGAVAHRVTWVHTPKPLAKEADFSKFDKG